MVWEKILVKKKEKGTTKGEGGVKREPQTGMANLRVTVQLRTEGVFRSSLVGGKKEKRKTEKGMRSKTRGESKWRHLLTT